MQNTMFQKFHITTSSSHEQKIEIGPVLVNNIHGLDSLLWGKPWGANSQQWASSSAWSPQSTEKTHQTNGAIGVSEYNREGQITLAGVQVAPELSCPLSP